MGHTSIFLDILIVLIAAKAAGEVAERIRLPAVCGEIVAGLLIGPSALGLVHSSEVLAVLGEIGVLLLLLEVGLETELAGLLAVGRASLSVAVAGIVLPFAGGIIAGSAFGYSGKTSLFLAAALTATSVGITARVFGDLRALGTREARMVLGAAVADDVMGLVILTVVVGVIADGSVSLPHIAKVIALALGFLVVASAVGVRLAPRLFDFVSRHGRSSGTLIAVALAFMLAVSEAAHAAELAPIVGAFVAGIALQRSPAATQVRHELGSVGHLFIPVFFLNIGINAEISRFASGTVLANASILLVIAVVGKVCAGLAVRRRDGDRLLIGLGMIPRGEVGLIFATIGLAQGVFSDEQYAEILLVVLVSTVVTPALLRWRVTSRSAPPVASTSGDATGGGPGQWLRVEHGRVGLRAEPPASEAVATALRAATLADRQQPEPELLDWLGSVQGEDWSSHARQEFYRLIATGGARSWRLLWVSGVLARTLPEIDGAVARKQGDVAVLDPLQAFSWPRLEHVRGAAASEPARTEVLQLSAFILDLRDGHGDTALAESLLARVRADEVVQHAVAAAVRDAQLLRAAANRIDSLGPDAARKLALHVGSADHLAALVHLAHAEPNLSVGASAAIDSLAHRLHELLDRPADGIDQAASHREAAIELATDDFVARRIRTMPEHHLLETTSDALVRQASLCAPLLGRHEVRVAVTPLSSPTWIVEFAALDRVGLMAAETGALAEIGADIRSGAAITWLDGVALATFTVDMSTVPDIAKLRDSVHRQLGATLVCVPVPDAHIDFDDHASPWHTLCHLAAPDRGGLLRAITAAFAISAVSVRSARLGSVAGAAVDVFELTAADGAKLTDDHKAAITNALLRGVTPAAPSMIERLLAVR